MKNSQKLYKLREAFMKILGIHLGHNSHFALIEDGIVKSVFEAERFYRFKGFKLHAYTLEPKKIISSYQYVNVQELIDSLQFCLSQWGYSYDFVGVECQGRKKEFKNLQIILKDLGVKYKGIELVNHHLSHASSVFFTSKFKKALILSYDGYGNDGVTLLFHGEGNKISYLKSFLLSLGRVYNNASYILKIKPDVTGQGAGKIMGLAGYGKIRKKWIPAIQKHIIHYKKRISYPIKGVRTYGKGHPTNSDFIEVIKDFKPYFKVETPIWAKIGFNIAHKLKLYRIRNFISNKKGYFQFNSEMDEISQDFMKTFQKVWTDVVINLFKKYEKNYKHFCITGGCALNGITNYYFLKRWGWKNVYLIPNPSDCGLGIGAALKVYWQRSGKRFEGYPGYYDPYVGMELFDKDKLKYYKENFSNRVVPHGKYISTLAKLIYNSKVIGLIQEKCEIGPRALGNRSILCNPAILDMKKILNEKVKHREWFRPFAPVCTLKDAPIYFTSEGPINYMSVICYTREEFRDKLPSITHVDGTARLQTITREQNPFLYDLLKEFEKLSGYPILLNTSLNPRGEPILNYLKVGLEMIENTGLDYIAYNNTIFGKEESINQIDEM